MLLLLVGFQINSIILILSVCLRFYIFFFCLSVSRKNAPLPLPPTFTNFLSLSRSPPPPPSLVLSVYLPVCLYCMYVGLYFLLVSPLSLCLSPPPPLSPTPSLPRPSLFLSLPSPSLYLPTPPPPLSLSFSSVTRTAFCQRRSTRCFAMRLKRQGRGSV